MGHQQDAAELHQSLPHLRIGKYIRFDRVAVLAWLEGTSTAKRKPKRADSVRTGWLQVCGAIPHGLNVP